MLKLENSIRGLSFSRVAFDLTIQAAKIRQKFHVNPYNLVVRILNLRYGQSIKNYDVRYYG